MLYICTISVNADELTDLSRLLPDGSNVAYIIGNPVASGATSNNNSSLVPPESRYMMQSNAELLLTPASTQKLITALAAKLYLTDEFSFETNLHGTITQRYLKNTEFSFTGDPTFTRRDLRSMLHQLKAKGVDLIKGDIQLNDSYFNGYNWSNGQVWNDQAVCYATQASALVINNNCVLGNLKRTPDLHIARIFVPNYEPISLDSKVLIMTKEQQKANFCDLEVTRKPNNQYTLFGCITPSQHNLPLAFAISDPRAYFTALLKTELTTANIQFSGKVTSKKQITTAPVIIRHESVTVDKLISKMIKESDNLIADILFKTMGAVYFNQPGNYRNGAEAVRLILEDNGISLNSSAIADGSGLSRHNLVSAHTMFNVLSYVIAHNEQLHLFDDLPISGVDGTLKYKKGLLTSLLKGKVIAKTGSLKGLSNLVGVVKTEQNNTIPFVLMINGYHPSPSAQEKLANNRLPSPLTQYLEAFFSAIAVNY
jgi:D-alanyl-D-alanine carboxypeptidase/D-alanyl-D-alanine-endopeptidase (penicillin-binding protein 4)